MGSAACGWQMRSRSLLGPGVPVQKPRGGAVLLFQAAALTPETTTGELDTWLMAERIENMEIKAEVRCKAFPPGSKNRE